MRKQVLILFFMVIVLLSGCQNLGDKISERGKENTLGVKPKQMETNYNGEIEENKPEQNILPEIKEEKKQSKNKEDETNSKEVAQNNKNHRIFFGSNKYNPAGENCEAVYWINIPYDGDLENPVAKNINLLLAGLPEKWLQAGYYTSIPENTQLNSSRIEDGVIYLDFSSELNQGGGSCLMAQRRWQITATAKAAVEDFLGQEIDKVVITVNGGSSEEALQP